MKIDIDGSELDFFQGAKNLSRIKQIMIELCDHDINFPKITSRLNLEQFKLKVRYKIPEENNIFKLRVSENCCLKESLMIFKTGDTVILNLPFYFNPRCQIPPGYGNFVPNIHYWDSWWQDITKFDGWKFRLRVKRFDIFNPLLPGTHFWDVLPINIFDEPLHCANPPIIPEAWLTGMLAGRDAWGPAAEVQGKVGGKMSNYYNTSDNEYNDPVQFKP